MSVIATQATWKIQNISAIQKLILLALADRAGESHECWPSLKRMQSDTNLNRKTLIENRNLLVDMGYIGFTGEMRGKTKLIPVMRLLYIPDEGHSPDDTSFPPYSNTTLSSTENGTVSSDANSTENGIVKQYRKRYTEPKRIEPKIIKEKEINKEKESLPISPSEPSPLRTPSSHPLTPAYRETLYPMPSKRGKSEISPEVINNNPFNIPMEMIEDFLCNRRAKRAPLTKTAWNGLNKQLQRCYEKGSDPIKAFETMVMNGWQSLNADWIDKHKSAPRAPEGPYYDNRSYPRINRPGRLF